MAARRADLSVKRRFSNRQGAEVAKEREEVFFVKEEGPCVRVTRREFANVYPRRRVRVSWLGL